MKIKQLRSPNPRPLNQRQFKMKIKQRLLPQLQRPQTPNQRQNKLNQLKTLPKIKPILIQSQRSKTLHGSLANLKSMLTLTVCYLTRTARQYKVSRSLKPSRKKVYTRNLRPFLSVLQLSKRQTQQARMLWN